MCGILVNRNVGEYSHSFLQLVIGMALKVQGLRSYTELRLQVRSDSFRIPDILALGRGQKRGLRYETQAPYIVVEILSPDDRVADLNDKLLDYFDMAIPNIWVVDPHTKTLTAHAAAESRIYRDRVATTDGLVALDLADIFRQLAEDEANIG